MNLAALMVHVFHLINGVMEHKIVLTNLMKRFVNWLWLIKKFIAKNHHLNQKNCKKRMYMLILQS